MKIHKIGLYYDDAIRKPAILDEMDLKRKK